MRLFLDEEILGEVAGADGALRGAEPVDKVQRTDREV